MKNYVKLLFLALGCLAIFCFSRCGNVPTTPGSGIIMLSDSAGPINSGGGGKAKVVKVVIDSPYGVNSSSGSDSTGPINTGGGGAPKSAIMHMIQSSYGAILVDQALYNNLTKSLGEKKAHQHTVFLLMGVNYDVADSVRGGNTGPGGHPPAPPKQVSVPNNLINQLTGAGG